MDRNIDILVAPAAREEPMELEIYTHGRSPKLPEPRSFESSGFAMNQENLLKSLEKLVLDRYQRTPRSSTAFSDAEWKERLFDTLSACAIPSSDDFDDNARIEAYSDQIKAMHSKLQVKSGKVFPDDFMIYVDCHQFYERDLSVKVENYFITVHAVQRHEFDKHGLVYREFTRRWPIPEDVKSDKIECLFDRYNILTIRAPRKPISVNVEVKIELPKKDISQI